MQYYLMLATIFASFVLSLFPFLECKVTSSPQHKLLLERLTIAAIVYPIGTPWLKKKKWRTVR